MRVDYFLLDPTGNVTILVDSPVPPERQPAVAARLMALEPAAEQVGFISREEGCDLSLRMAGGEFCGNASMCAAVVAAEEAGVREGSIVLRVSGAADAVTAEVAEADGIWQGTVDMPRPVAIGRVNLPGAGERPVVRFDGISHIMLEEKMSRADAEEKAVAWCRQLGADAVGLMFIHRKSAAMTPLVYVPAAGTLFWENSCASGTSAAGAWLAAETGRPVSLTLRQPGGALKVDARPGGALRLTGSVRILGRGSAEVTED